MNELHLLQGEYKQRIFVFMAWILTTISYTLFKYKFCLANLIWKQTFAFLCPKDFVLALVDGAVAGAAAGVVVETVLYPIDTIKTRLQAGSFLWMIFFFCFFSSMVFCFHLVILDKSSRITSCPLRSRPAYHPLQ